jgi:tRNA-specific 2-thiouridylase
MAKIVVGLSGGVDSSVSAYLLQAQGHELIGLFMRNWNDSSVVVDNACTWVDDSQDALLVAQALGIPFQVVDLSEAYKQKIVDYMFAEYERGRTPNPDILCNREIKFDVFLQTALSLGAEFVATGHYCQKETIQNPAGETMHRLLAGADKNKDQSYFLSQLSQEQLSRALFPIGHLQKSQVRQIAFEQGLITADKKDSQGLCFVGKISLPTFLQQKLAPKDGDIIEIPNDSPIFSEQAQKIEQAQAADNETLIRAYAQPFEFKPQAGKKVAAHKGAHYYTIGQRKGLDIGGTKEPLFVIHTDTQANLIYVGQGQNHKGLFRKGLLIPQADAHWVRPDLALKMGESCTYQVRIRYRQPLVKATLYQRAEGIFIIFEDAQKGITPGQFAAWYDGEELIGSGVIL